MGFGLLFIGYFLTVMNIPILGAFGTVVRIFGVLLTIAAILKLKNYNNAFNISLVGAFAMFVMSLLLFAVGIDNTLFEYMIVTDKFFSPYAITVIGYVDQGVTFVFNSLLLWAIYCIAKETEAKKIAVNSIRNFIFVCAYAFVYAISFLPFSGIRSAKQEFAVITWILYFVWIIFNLLLLFSCYANICDESDVEMEKRPSRFEFVNKFNDKFEKHNRDARDADAAYRREKAEKREARRKRKNK